MALTTVIAPAIGYLAYHKNLESDQQPPDKFLKRLGLLNPITYEVDAPLKHVDDDKPIWPSVREIVKSMEEDRMTKSVVSDVVLGRYLRSPESTTSPDNQGMMDLNSRGNKPNGQRRSGRAAQMPPGMPEMQMPPGMPPPGMPDIPKPPKSVE